MEEIIVAKFGGSSLGEGKQFEKVKNIILADPRRKYIIPSAPGKRDDDDHKITDLLYMCYQLASHGLNFDEVYSIVERRFEDICKNLGLQVDMEEILSTIKEKIRGGASQDYVASRGEYLNGIILSHYLGFEFVDAKDIIRFDSGGNLDWETTKIKIKQRLQGISQAVIPGFYGAGPKGEILTFSRGGSDITGAIISRGVEAILYENWTDVSGFLMADPKIIENPNPIETITYKELRELSYMGAPVLHEESIFPVKIAGIPVNIRNTNAIKEPGTIIVDDKTHNMNAGTITGIAGKKDFTVISIEKTLMSLDRGFYRKLITVLETNGITIEHMPTSIDTVSLIISNAQLNSKLEKVMEEIRIYCKPDSIITYPNMALIAVVGRGMIRTQGVSSRVFTALAQEGVNIRMITQGSSELNIIIGVKNADFDRGIAAIYHAFNK